MNRGELRQLVLDEWGVDAVELAALTSLEAEANKYLAEAARIIARRSRSLFSTMTYTTEPYVLDHNLPESCTGVVYVYDSTNEVEVLPRSLDYLDRREPSWRDIYGSGPTVYFTTRARHDTWTKGRNTLMLWPATAAGGISVDVTYTYGPAETTLGDDDSEPLVSRAYHESLVSYAVARRSLINARDDATIRRALKRLGIFKKAVRDLTAESEEARDRIHKMGPERRIGDHRDLR